MHQSCKEIVYIKIPTNRVRSGPRWVPIEEGPNGGPDNHPPDGPADWWSDHMKQNVHHMLEGSHFYRA